MPILKFLAEGLVTLFISLGLISSPLGGLPNSPALLDTFLSSPISSTASSMTISDTELRSGEFISGEHCFTLNSGTPETEFVCGSVASSTGVVSSLTRGLSLVDGVSTSTDRAFSHRRFTSVQVTDFPLLQRQVRLLNGDDGFDSPLKYSTTTAGFVSASDQLAHKLSLIHI